MNKKNTIPQLLPVRPYSVHFTFLGTGGVKIILTNHNAVYYKSGIMVFHEIYY
ncbi:MAG: hypothetical protein ACRCY5_01090 [Phocaeicola sp.]